MADRATEQAREAMRQADREAGRFNHEFIGTEHILLGLIPDGPGGAGYVLENLGVDPQRVRLEVERIVLAGPALGPWTGGYRPQTPRAKSAIEHAVAEARNLNHSTIGAEHLLLGLLREGDGVAALVLISLGVRLEDAREEVRRELARPPIDPTWLWRNDGAVEKIARGIVESRRWETLPILADALEDAGCGEVEILRHLRLGAGHGCLPLGHGCWVLDRLLGARAGEDDGDQRPARRWWRFWR